MFRVNQFIFCSLHSAISMFYLLSNYSKEASTKIKKIMTPVAQYQDPCAKVEIVGLACNKNYYTCEI